ncbi:MAG: PHP domain-containing protein [Rickettsiales bacterium]|jgi:predicted metal-dependent phosphoesterase TrpH|nr:PHP domain-containing protein [Rickettsiales bacterium]
MKDLHVHSHYSDGGFSPTEILKKADEAGLNTIALVDHDTITGINEFLESGKVYPHIKKIVGCEFSAIASHELHILALDVKNLNYMREWTSELDTLSFEYAKAAAIYLNKIGIKTIYEDLIKDNIGSFGCLDITKYLVKRGIESDPITAYNKYIEKNEFLDKYDLKQTKEKIIPKIIEADGVSVLAHPKRTGFFDKTEFKKFLKSLVDLGLQGLECYYSTHTLEEVEFYLKCAKDFKLVVSGGSDFHYEGHPQRQLGYCCSKTMKIPDEIFL